MVWTLFGVRYIVPDAQLDIRSGPLLWSVPLASIRSVEPTRDATSSPAWSLDRLRVTATERTVLISPHDKAGLLDALQARDPGLRRDGERLVRMAEQDTSK
jgi:Bacterial PH domain